MPQARKQFGQRWLRSEKALSQIVAAAELSESDRVLEIGPGTGILTRLLLASAGAVVAVELDRDLCELLTSKLGAINHFLLLQGDILSLDLENLLDPLPQFQQPNKVVANIPYNITGPILQKLLGTIAHPNPNPYDRIVLLVQREIALRLKANPGSRHFGALSVQVQYLADCDFICDVPSAAFHPPPKVDSAVIRLRPHSPEPPVQDPHLMQTLVKSGFASKRKMLRNNLQSILDREALSSLLEQLQVNPQARAEELSVANWIALSNALIDKG
ncbi:MAG: 16S rRNA (adenine(1518)-N(6)/adenine(1519)-N(6))-dimethyltransferase RsmA [Leptolyngbyaceae cyanobacterium]